MYNSALVMQQQPQAIGIYATVPKATDWPTSDRDFAKPVEAGTSSSPAGAPAGAGRIGGNDVLLRAAANVFPAEGHPDPRVMALWDQLNSVPTEEERNKILAEMQKYALDQVYAVPFVLLTKVQSGTVAREGIRAAPHSATR